MILSEVFITVQSSDGLEVEIFAVSLEGVVSWTLGDGILKGKDRFPATRHQSK